MARPYRPVKGQGYAVIEPIGWKMGDLLPAGSVTRFRVSLRRVPPLWHEERVIEVAEDLTFENLEVTIIASSLLTPSSPIRMVRTPEGDYVGWFTLVAPLEKTNLWVGTSGKGLFCLAERDKRWERVQTFTARNSGLAVDRDTTLVLSSGKSSERTLWIGTPCGLSCYTY